MGISCLKLKQENYPSKIEVIAGENKFYLRSVPDSFLSLDTMINCKASKYCPQTDPLNYYSITYVNEKVGFHLKLLDDKSYRAAARSAKGETLKIKIEPSSYRNMIYFSIKKTGIFNFDSLLSLILPKVSELEENVASLLQSYDAIMKFSRCFCVRCSCPTFQMSVTVLLLAILSDCRSKGCAYNFLSRFPFIEFNTDSLGSEGKEAARYWNDMICHLEKVLPAMNEVCETFKRMQKMIQFEVENFQKNKEIDLSVLLENSKSMSQCALIGKPLERKIKSIYKDIEEASVTLQNPQDQKILEEVSKMIKLSKANDACSAIGLFGLRGSLRVNV
ncbi:unnamed protein product [Blepharisma stoltei]|uniref:Uncharacterized protein n=1 Tax=Blepharisma stoltei TaxID=1481888 RepID=A0AAU9JRF0_9CILI|nr:unnamed protein product [Blepharisma stoltei]